MEKKLSYWERALSLQSKKIESQKLELARMNSVYTRNVKNTKIISAFKFLLDVILAKYNK